MAAIIPCVAAAFSHAGHRLHQHRAAAAPCQRRRNLRVAATASANGSSSSSKAYDERNGLFPDFFPPEAAEIEEPAARRMMQVMRRTPLTVEGLGEVQTAFVGPEAPSPSRPAFVLLHGFDSSSLEFRRFLPLLSQVADVWAVDLAGWGFTGPLAGMPHGSAQHGTAAARLLSSSVLLHAIAQRLLRLRLQSLCCRVWLWRRRCRQHQAGPRTEAGSPARLPAAGGGAASHACRHKPGRRCGNRLRCDAPGGPPQAGAD